jgi:putative membrane protein
MQLFAWLVPWEPSPTVVIAIAIAAVLYVRGCGIRQVSIWRRLSFWIGLSLLYFALHTRLDYYAEHAFFVHRIQHLLLHHLGPFLIALSYPGSTLYAGMPVAWRRRWLIPSLNWKPVRAVLNVLLHPVVAALLFVGLIYFWLISSVHFNAMLDVRLYRVMNWSMALDGLMFWWLVLDNRPAPPARLAPGTRILLIVAVIPPQILIGAILGLSPHDFYTVYSICGRAFTNISPITDQHLGGLILWIPGAMMSVIGALIALRHWMRLSESAEKRRRLEKPVQGS